MKEYFTTLSNGDTIALAAIVIAIIIGVVQTIVTIKFAFEKENSDGLFSQLNLMDTEFDEASHDLILVLQNAGQPISFLDNNWLLQPMQNGPDGIKPHNCYCIEPSQTWRTILFERIIRTSYSPLPVTLKHGEEIRLGFQHIEGTDTGTGNHIHFRITFSDPRGTEFFQDIMGHHWDRIYLRPPKRGSSLYL